VASSFFAACSATGGIDTDFDAPLPGGGNVRGHIWVHSDGEQSMEIDSTKPICLEICFSGSRGEDLGCVTIEVPGSAQVPAGAVRWEASIVPCPDAGGGGGGGGGGMFEPFTTSSPAQSIGSQQNAGHGQRYQWNLLGGIVYPVTDGNTNVNYSFQINAPTLDAAKARRDLVLSGGIGTPVGFGFNIIYYNESEAELDSLGVPQGVRMRQAEVNDEFTTFALTVNDVLFAELGLTGNLLRYDASNGWNVVETFVPNSAFDTNVSTFDNSVYVSWTTARTQRTWQAFQRVAAH
jgi:hypothetical protein